MSARHFTVLQHSGSLEERFFIRDFFDFTKLRLVTWPEPRFHITRARNCLIISITAGTITTACRKAAIPFATAPPPNNPSWSP
jgi:hypothetical protein